MRIVTGGIAQETNTFQWESTTLADFQRPGFGTIVRGQQILALEGTGTVYGGAVAEPRRLGVELIPTTYGRVMPGVGSRARRSTRCATRSWPGSAPRCRSTASCSSSTGRWRWRTTTMAKALLHRRQSAMLVGPEHPDRGAARPAHQPLGRDGCAVSTPSSATRNIRTPTCPRPARRRSRSWSTPINAGTRSRRWRTPGCR